MQPSPLNSSPISCAGTAYSLGTVVCCGALVDCDRRCTARRTPTVSDLCVVSGQVMGFALLSSVRIWCAIFNSVDSAISCCTTVGLWTGPLLRTLPDDARPIHSLLLVERRFVRSQTDAMLSSAQRTLRAVGVSGSRYARRTVGRHGATRRAPVWMIP
jgi:hypothetical protein